MSNKMLIDASHPEETRVAVVRGNRIEEFDFESQEKKQLRGNIYLAKVTRVEPSLQAAFVDYGGNRHGFLAFSEIHPDYYQIPMADRQALLDAEAEEARAYRDEDDADNGSDEVEEVTSEEDEAPKKKPRRRRSRKAKTQEPEAEASEETTTEASEEEKPAEETAEVAEAPAEEASDAVEVEAAEPAPEEAKAEEKPKRRTTRRKPAAKKTTAKAKKEEAEAEAKADDSSDDDAGEEPTTMAAMVEMDSISEPLPDDEEPESEDDNSDEATAEAEEAPKEKPKRRTTRRKPAAKKPAKEAVVAEAEAEVASEEPAAEETEAPAEQVEEAVAEEEKKPARKPRRRSPRGKKAAEDKKAEASEGNSDDDNGDTNGDDDKVENVGQEDAMEEMPKPRRTNRRHYKIQEVIKRRQVLLVQVVKEERGTKGAALTTYLSLAGRYSVLMPNTARGGGISRKITNAADRKRLKAIAGELEVPQGMGVILRTAGASRTNEEINRDFEYLMRLWEQVRNLTLASSAPCLVYEEGSLIKRSIRDLYNKDISEIVVSGDAGHAEAKDFMTMLMPTHTKNVRHYRDPQAIFAKFGVETQLDRMVTPQVTLKSGGYLVINQTEALVAVDVNSGRSTREHSIEDTALQTNLEAAEEVARQLRLRDLAGLIVIDFIDMEEKRNNRSVEKKLKDCLKNDRARIQVGRISHFGLMEMSRQRIRASVLESTMDVCSLCSGTGHVRSDSAIALHVFRAIEEHVARHNRYDAVIKTTPAIAIHLLNHKRAALLDLESRYGLKILIEGDYSIKGQDFAIEKGEAARGEPASNAVGFQNDTTYDVGGTEEASEEEGRGRKRGRGRRRRGGRNEEVEAAKEEAETTEDQKETENTAAEDGEKPARKRRRGKRGGRNRDNGGASEENKSEEETSATAETPVVEAKAETEAAPEAVEDAKPKRRTSRRKKADTEAPAETAVTAEPAAEAVVEETPEPEKAEAVDEKPKRRTTRRKEVAASTEEETPVSEPANEAPADEAPAESDGKKPRKVGWWNRGGGFF